MLTLAQIIDGFLLDQEARQLSKNTIRDYRTSLKKLQAFLVEDLQFDKITKSQVVAFLTDLGENPQPHPGATKRAPKPLSKKTILNVHIGLSALWTWAVAEGYVDRHLMREIEPPRPERRAVDPFTESDLKRLMRACQSTLEYVRNGRLVRQRRPTMIRDEAIVLLLLDTGMRAHELCGLTVRDVDIKNRKLRVMGKGDRERVLQFSARTGKSLWRYMTRYRGESGSGEAVFLSKNGRPITSHGLLQFCYRLGQRAEVSDCHPHRFRHTFAINYLRYGGDAYTLQSILGHSTMEMVRRYLNLAQMDIAAAHRRASPVENMKL